MTARIMSEQVKQFKHFVEDAADRALKEDAPDKEALQELFAREGEFQAYIREGIRKFSIKGAVFPVYLNIAVGGKSKNQLLKELQSGFNVYGSTEDIMGAPSWKPGKREQVKFACVKIRELGFTKNPTTTALWARIRDVAALCEPYDGPAIRLALKDQPYDECFWCAMEQITDTYGSAYVFILKRVTSKPRLCTGWAPPDNAWNLDNRVVFRLRK